MSKVLRVPGEVYKDKNSGVNYLYLGNITYKKTGKKVSGETFVKLGTNDKYLSRTAKKAVDNLTDGNVKTNNQGLRLNPKIKVGNVTERCLSDILKKVRG